MSGMTKAEKDRRAGAKQNAAAAKKNVKTGAAKPKETKKKKSPQKAKSKASSFSSSVEKAANSAVTKVMEDAAAKVKASRSTGASQKEAKGSAGTRNSETPHSRVNRDDYDQRVRSAYGERNTLGDMIRSDARDLAKTGRVPKRTYDYGLKRYVTEEESRTASRTRDQYDQNARASYGERKNQRLGEIYTPATKKKKGKQSYGDETRDYAAELNEAMKLEPDEMFGVKIGSAEDRLKGSESFTDKSALQRDAVAARNYFEHWNRIDPKDQGKAAAYIIYGIGLNDETENTVMKAFQNASDDDRIMIYQTARQTAGYTDAVKKMEKELKSGIQWATDKGYQNKVNTATIGMHSNPTEQMDRFAQDMKASAAGQPTAKEINLYTSYQKGMAFSKEWAKTHNYSNMDYFIDHFWGAGNAFSAGLIDALGMNVADLTDVSQEEYLTSGVRSPWQGMSGDKRFVDNGVQMITNIVSSVFSIAKLPLKLITKGFSYIPGIDDSLKKASYEAMHMSDPWRKGEEFFNFKATYAGADKSKAVKTAGNIERFVVENLPGMVISIFEPALGTGVFGAQAGGSYGRAAYDNGATLDEAISYGTIAALAEVGTEKLFPMAGTFGKTLTERVFSTSAMKMAKDKYLYSSTVDLLERSGFQNSTSGRILKNVLEGGGEATEEMIMEVVNPYLQRATYDEDAEAAKPMDILESGLYGAAVAAVLHLPANTLHATGDAKNAFQRLSYKMTAADRKNDAMKIIRNELSLGLISEAEAKERSKKADIDYRKAMELYDVASGKGSLRVSSRMPAEEKITGSDLGKVYPTYKEGLDAERGTVTEGEVTFRALDDDGNVNIYHVPMRNGSIAGVARSSAEIGKRAEAYKEKAARIGAAKNEAERSGVQLNVRSEIIEQVSDISEAIGRDVVFEDMAADEAGNVTRGYFDEKTGKIHVNIRTRRPAAAVIAHEITHSLEKTAAYDSLKKVVFDYYQTSVGADRRALEALYAEGGKTLRSQKDVDSEVMAKFVETKLLTDAETIRRVTAKDRTLAQRFVDWLNNVIQKLAGNKEQRFLVKARDLWQAALAEERTGRKLSENKKAPSAEGGKKYAFEGYAEDGRGMYTGAFKVGTPRSDKAITIKDLVQNLWHKEPIPLVVKDGDHSRRIIWARFDPTYSDDKSVPTDLTKLMGGNRHGTASDQRVTLNLAEDYPKLLKEARYNGHKKEEGKTSLPHQNVDEWYYFINDIYYAEKGSEKFEPYRVSINVKHIFEGKKGYWVYSYSAEKQKEINAPQTLHAAVSDEERFFIPNADSSIDSISDSSENDNRQFAFGKEKIAEEYFGITAEFREAGYLTTNGKLLDFSGVKFGGRKGRRSMDHREISDIYENEGYDGGEAMVAFMNEGNIRIAPEIPGIDLSVRPNEQQEKILRRYFDRYNGYITLDISNEYGDNELSFDYPKGTKATKIINDIRNYFDNGVEPYVSEVSKYRYAFGKETDRKYMDVVQRGDMETAQRMVDEAAKAAGYTKKLYHQTDAEFTVFDPRHKGAGSRDNETPYGIFMKTSPANIGLKGEKQMALYAKIQNPLVADNRSTLRKMIEDLSPEYRNLKEEIKNIDRAYGEKFENAKTVWKNYIIEWRKNNPDAKRTALYDDPEFQKLFDAEDTIVEEWTEKASNLDGEAKEEITRALTDSGYDGIILRHDEGSFGRSTDAYIALDSSQVKSADAVTYDENGDVVPLSERFKEDNDDIRYAYGSKEEGSVKSQMRNHLGQLNAMQVVAEIDNPGITWRNRKELGDYLVEVLKKSGYKVERRNFGVISFDEGLLRESAKYIQNEVEAIAYESIPRVLKRGIEVGQHKDHKARGLDTVTFAAPIEINGERCNVAVVVKTNKGNRFKVLRILAVTGTKVKMKKDIVPTTGGGLSQKRTHATPIGTTSKHSISDFVENDNRKFAYGKEEAESYFVGSVVELNGERGTVVERKTAHGTVTFTVELDNGERIEHVQPEDFTVGVTTDFRFDELPKEDQDAWMEPPADWDMSKDIGDVSETPVSVKDFTSILYENGITVGSRKLKNWFKNNGYLLKNGDHPTKKSLDAGWFAEKKGKVLLTERGQRYFLDMFSQKDMTDEFTDLDQRKGIVLPGNERQGNSSPLEDVNVREMLYVYEDEITDTGEDYSWATLLTGRGVRYAKDYARNFDAAAGFNPNLRKHLQRTFVRPLEKGKADYANAVRDRLNEMYAKMKELGIRKDTKEAAAVQWIGEGQYADKYGEIREYTPEMLRKEFPEKYKQIEEAASYCRSIYDQYLKDINSAREKIYPHPLEDAQDRMAGYEARRTRVEERIGDQRKIIAEIEKVISAKKKEFPKKQDGTKAKANLAHSIRYNEDRLTKAKKELENFIERRNKYDSMVKSIAADIESGDILRNKRIIPRKDYFHHFQEMTSSLGDVFTLSRNTTEIDPRMEGTSGYTEPKSKFSGITLHRYGGRYKADAIEGMIRYVQTAEYMIHIDPVIAEFRSHIKGMAEATKESRNCNKLIRWLVQWTNDLAGKTNPGDRFIQDIIGRDMVMRARNLNSRAKANAVVGNLNSATAQIFNLPNLAGYILDPKAYAGGLADTLQFIARKQEARALIRQSGFMNERYLDDAISQFNEKWTKQPEKLAAWTLTVGDRYSTVLIWFTAYHDAVNDQRENPIEYADDITRRCVAGRGIGEIPIMQKSVVTQIAAPFQIEVNNAWQLYKEKINGIKNEKYKTDKAYSAVSFAMILVANFLLNTITDLLLHRRVAFDPIYVFFECLHDWLSGDDDDEEKNAGDKFFELLGREAGEVLGNMPYGSLIAYYLFNTEWGRENLFGEQDPTRFGVGAVFAEPFVELLLSLYNGDDLTDDLLNLATTFVLPFGGKQLERTLEGLVNMGYLPDISFGRKIGFSFGRVEAPGVYTRKGQLQYPLETFGTDRSQALMNLIFGKYATDAGQKYLGKDYEGSSFWQNVFGWNASKERSALSERATETFKKLVAGGGDAFEIYDTIRAIQDAENSINKRKILMNSELSADEKANILLGIIVAEDSVESETKKLNGILSARMTVDDYLYLRNVHAEINKDESLTTASDRAWAFHNELIAAGYSADQISSISNTLKYWSQVPADTSKFDKLANTGMDSETSMKVINALSALEPLEDETTVSSLQKVEAIAGLNLSAEDEKAAMSLALDKKSYAKYTAVAGYSVSAQVWADFEKALASADTNNPNETKRNGKYDNDEKAAALDSMKISNDTKAALWQIKDAKLGSKDKDTAWKAARNPYSSAVGAAVVDAYMKSTTEVEENLPAYTFPVGTDNYRFSSDVGYRSPESTNGVGSTNHHGLDIATYGQAGVPAYSLMSGEVVYTKSSNKGYGNHVMIRNDDGYYVLYGHLASYSGELKAGDRVTAGQQIGIVGSTGNSTGIHLHLEVRETESSNSWVNPNSVYDLDGDGVLLEKGASNQQFASGTASTSYSGVGSSGSSSGGRRKSGGGSRKSSGGSTSVSYNGGNKLRAASQYDTGGKSGGSSGSGSGSGGIMLPTASQAAAITARSTKAASYSGGGVMLPTAKELAAMKGGNGTIQYNRRGISTPSTTRTARSTGTSYWTEDILG